MKIFISWSGKQSQEFAVVLRDWLPTILPQTKPWVSSVDIAKGVPWFAELLSQLDTSAFGIICVTRNNAASPWLNFEAGVIYKTLDARVAPLLFDISPDKLTGPMAQLQATVFDSSDLLRLVYTINRESGEAAVPEPKIEKTWKHSWPSLNTQIHSIDKSSDDYAPLPASDRISQANTNEGITDDEVAILQTLAKNHDQEKPVVFQVHTIAKRLSIPVKKCQYYVRRLLQLKYLFITLDGALVITDAGTEYLISTKKL